MAQPDQTQPCARPGNKTSSAEPRQTFVRCQSDSTFPRANAGPWSHSAGGSQQLEPASPSFARSTVELSMVELHYFKHPGRIQHRRSAREKFTRYTVDLEAECDIRFTRQRATNSACPQRRPAPPLLARPQTAEQGSAHGTIESLAVFPWHYWVHSRARPRRPRFQPFRLAAPP